MRYITKRKSRKAINCRTCSGISPVDTVEERRRLALVLRILGSSPFPLMLILENLGLVAPPAPADEVVELSAVKLFDVLQKLPCEPLPLVSRRFPARRR